MPPSRLINYGRAGVSLKVDTEGSRPTNIDLEAPLIAFAMRELRAEMVAPVHYLLAEALWARIKNRPLHKCAVLRGAELRACTYGWFLRTGMTAFVCMRRS